MPTRVQVASVLDVGRDDGRPARQRGQGRALSGWQRAPRDQRVRLHDLPRRSGLGNRLHVRVAYSQLARAGRGVGKGAWLEGFPLLGLPHVPQAVHRSELPEMPSAGHRHPPGDEAAGWLPTHRQVWMHWLPCHRRRGLERPRSLGRTSSRAQSFAHRRQERQGVGRQMDCRSPRLPARFADAAVLRADQQRRQGRLAQELCRDPRDHPLPLHEEHAAGRVHRSAGEDRPCPRQGAVPAEGLSGLPSASPVHGGRHPAG